MADNSVHFVLSLILGVLSVSRASYEHVKVHVRDDLELNMITKVEQSHDKPHLGMDQAQLTILSKQKHWPLAIYAQYDVCHNCSYIYQGVIEGNSNLTLVISSQFPCTIMYRQMNIGNDSGQFCSKHHFGEHGDYILYIDPLEEEGDKCNLTPGANSPQDSFVPLYVTLAILIIMSLFWMLLVHLHRRNMFIKILIALHCWHTDALVNSDLGIPANQGIGENSVGSELAPPKKSRIKSLDTFRGLSLIIMIFVNYGGGQYWFMHHSTWNGLTVADLVFPWFTFIMGTSMALSFHGMLGRGAKRRHLAWKVIKRTAILVCLGLMISNFGKKGDVKLGTLRIPGVLQRLGITYLVVAMMEVFFARPNSNPNQQTRLAVVRDVLPYWPEWLLTMATVAIHLGLTFGLPLEEGCPTGYIGPGGLHDQSAYPNCTGGAAGFIDRSVFGTSHIYQHPTCKKWYMTTVPFDPEGILGTMTSVLICFLGLQAGKILICYTDWVQRVKRWLIWSVITGLIAGVLCNFHQNNGLIPVNKNLWSVSFILALSSMAYLLLTLCYILIDVFHLWSGTPFFYPGMNSIVVYVCHEVFEHYFPVQFHVQYTHAAQLAMNMYGAAIWLIVSVILHRKGIFVAI